jgi:hypothetical protein
MHVLQRGRAIIGKNEAIASGKRLEHTYIEVTCGVDRHPSGPRDVTGVKHRGREAVACGVQEKTLDLDFSNPVFSEWLARR